MVENVIFFFCVPSYISWVHHFEICAYVRSVSGNGGGGDCKVLWLRISSFSSVFPAVSLGFTILGEICACARSVRTRTMYPTISECSFLLLFN